MGFKEVPGGQEVLCHEDGRVRLGLRNLPRDSQRLVWKKDKKGNKLNEWPELVISTGLNEPERKMLLPEAVMKAQGKIPPSMVCHADDFTPKNGSRKRISDAGLDNIEFESGGKKAEGVAKGSAYIDKPENRKETGDKDAETKESKKKPDAPVLNKKDEEIPEDSGTPTPNEDAKAVSEGVAKLQKGSGELTAREAVKIIKGFDFEELRDLGFYTEDEREDGPRTTVVEAWEKKVAEFDETAS